MARIVLTEAQLTRNASRLSGKTAVVTGAASGIGKAAALELATHGANVVVADIDLAGAQGTADEIIQAGRKAIAQKTDVLIWDEQVSLFELALKTYGSVDIVVPAATASSSPDTASPGSASPFGLELDERGVPRKPDLRAVEVDLVGTMYTSHAAKFYFSKTRTDGDLKALVLVGSFSSWTLPTGGPPYTAAAKHGVLGFTRSLHLELLREHVRLGIVTPPTYSSFSATSDPRIAHAIVAAATDDDWATNTGAWIVESDDSAGGGGGVYRLNKETFREGVYGALAARLSVVQSVEMRIKRFVGLTSTLLRRVGGLKSVLLVLALAGALGTRAYAQRASS